MKQKSASAQEGTDNRRKEEMERNQSLILARYGKVLLESKINGRLCPPGGGKRDMLVFFRALFQGTL